MDSLYQRMLDKQIVPTVADMTSFCGESAELFSSLNAWLSETFLTEQKVVFPYGNHYGWGIAHRKNGKLICNVFAEKGAFTVMMRLSDSQWSSVYEQAHDSMRAYIDQKYPCGNGGWIQYRVISRVDFDDIRMALSFRCA